MINITTKALNKHKYVAIKPKALGHYLWFQTSKVKIEDFVFDGIEGWGLDGDLTEIIIPTDEISSVIYSNAPQYTTS